MIQTESLKLGWSSLVHILFMTRGRHLLLFKVKGQGHTLNIVAKPWKQDKPYLIANYNVIFLLRFCQTLITWLRSLSAILSFSWRHNMANIPTFAAKTWEVLLWRHKIHNVFLRNWAYTLQNVQFFHHFTMKFNIFSLNLTGDSDFLTLFNSNQNKLSMSGFKLDLNDQIFLLLWIIWSENFHFVVIFT